MTANDATSAVAATPVARIVACQAFQPLGWSSADTDATLRAVKLHNAAWAALCRPAPR